MKWNVAHYLLSTVDVKIVEKKACIKKKKSTNWCQTCVHTFVYAEFYFASPLMLMYTHCPSRCLSKVQRHLRSVLLNAMQLGGNAINNVM